MSLPVVDSTTPRQHLPPGQHPSPGPHTPRTAPPPATAPPSAPSRSTSGRYASYWNAFFFDICGIINRWFSACILIVQKADISQSQKITLFMYTLLLQTLSYNE